ncbi:MAG: OmpA family protein [Bacteroidia bacterium]
MKKVFFTGFMFTLLSLTLTKAQDGSDVNGSKDHSLITRYPGSIIGYYEEQNFIPYSIATGAVTGYKKIDLWKNVEGKRTRIYYTLKSEVTLTEVYRNYMQSMEKAGFKFLAKGIDDKNNVGKEVGGSTFLNVLYEKNPFANSKDIKLLQSSATSGGTFYLAGQLEANGASAYIILSGKQYSATEKVFMLDIIEETGMKGDLIKVNAAEMLKGIKANGKIALYGIYFDFDKADIKPESESTLVEISKLLTENPSLNLYVVGHTDMKGALEYNLTLSSNRAKAVVNELMKKYNIASSRLTGEGVGPLAPVSTNESEEGRKKNRRVELVAK